MVTIEKTINQSEKQYPTLHQVDVLLRRLGFERCDNERAVVFVEEAHKAVILLPLMEQDEILSPAHLLMIRNTVIGRGVISAQEYEDSLYQIEQETEIRTASELFCT